jgi:CRISPR-associated protein Cas5d
MGYGIRVEVWGDYALFSRPEMKVERVSYDMITPSAARGLIEAIYWHPGLRWHIDRIHVCNPIRSTNIRRNEVKTKLLSTQARSAMNGAAEPIYLNASEDIQQRASLVLKDVRYVIEAHFTMTDEAKPVDSVGKFIDIVRRRLEKGQFFHQPCFGCREFPAHFRPFTEDQIPIAPELYTQEEKDLGYMLYDMDYEDQEDIRPMFFRAVLKRGVLDLKDCGVVS